jgi:PDZ domain-containing secreted protein
MNSCATCSAVTGEIDLAGNVTAIGGLREKLYGAKQAGCQIVLFPFENMKDFYFMIKADTDCPEHSTIDFGKITDLNYLSELYIDANGIAPTDEKIDLAQAYINLQHTSIDDYNYLNMEEIAKVVRPQDLYDIAILLFMYEKNHNTIDQNRLWSIDNLPTDIDYAVEFLIKNSKNYSIF